MCNISGFCGDYSPTLAEIKLMAVMGRERGKDSCGVVINNERTIGFKEKIGTGTYSIDNGDSLTFIQNVPFTDSFSKNRTTLIHNRSASNGSKTIEGAHPYEYVDIEDENNKLFFAHNGTIYNTIDIAREYGYVFNDYHTDSHLMGLILFEKGEEAFIDALTKYEGFAVFVWFWANEPNTINIFKGASYKMVDEYKNGKKTNRKVRTLYEERPLSYITKVTRKRNGMYFSSLASHLDAISNGEEETHRFSANEILKYKGAELIENIPVNRDMDEYEKTSYYSSYSTTTHKKGKATKKSNTRYPGGFSYHPTDCHNLARGDIYWKEGRYYRGGKPADGKIYLTEDNVFLNVTPKFTKLKEILYFFKGVWLKDEDSFTFLQNNKHNITAVSIKYYHPNAYHVVNNSVLYYGDKFLRGEKVSIKGRFMFKEYLVKSGIVAAERPIKVKKSETNIVPFTNGYNNDDDDDYADIFGTTGSVYVDTGNGELSLDEMTHTSKDNVLHDCIATFNNLHNTTFSTRQQCNDYFNQYNLLEEKELEIIPHGIEDVKVMNFNITHNTSFARMRSCNTYYEQKYNQPYDHNWP